MKKTILLSLALLFAFSLVSAQNEGAVTYPSSIKAGDKIALVTPASAIKDSVIDRVVLSIKGRGYEPVVMPHAYGKEFGTYPVNDSLRAADINAAFADPSIKAIICTRGGYGCVRLLPYLDKEIIQSNPKWLVGFSDVSVLHAYLYKLGVASIHGVMCAHIANEKESDQATETLFAALSGELPLTLNAEPHAYNRQGSVTGTMLGGNFAVLNGLADTEYDILNSVDGAILFLEDVEEAPHSIERMLQRLHMSGALDRASGLVFGLFTDYEGTDDYACMEDLIYDWLNQWGYYGPDSDKAVVFNFPVGHVFDNLPIIEGSRATLDVKEDGVSLTMRTSE